MAATRRDIGAPLTRVRAMKVTFCGGTITNGLATIEAASRDPALARAMAAPSALSLVTHDERLTPKQVRAWLSAHEEIEHSTIGINHCPAGPA